MKKIVLVFLIINGFVNAQEVIYEGDFKGEVKLAGGFRTLASLSKQNKIILIDVKNLFNQKIFTLDENGKTDKIEMKPTAMNFQESSSGKTKVFSSNNRPLNIYTNDDKMFEFKFDFFEKFNASSFKCVNFNDSYVLGLGDEKGDEKVNLKKESFYLHLYDFRNQKSSKYIMDLPDLARYTSNINKSLAYSIFNLDNEGFDFVTKNVSKDFKNCIIYITRYNLSGKIVSEKEIVINSGDDYLLASNNNAGQMDYTGESPAGKAMYRFDDILFVNNIYFDENEKYFYVYGLYGKKGNTDVNDRIEANGYYVFKYSPDGKLIWKKFNEVNFNKEFNSKFYPFLMDNYLTKINDKLCFIASADRLKHYVLYSTFDKTNGVVISQNEYLSDEKIRFKYFQTQFLYSGHKIEDFPNKLLSSELLASMNSNSKILEYIKGLQNKKEIILWIVNFESISILVETDNSKYFKFTKFKI